MCKTVIECNGLGSQLIKDRNGRFFKFKNLAINKRLNKKYSFFSCISLIDLLFRSLKKLKKKNMLEM